MSSENTQPELEQIPDNPNYSDDPENRDVLEDSGKSEFQKQFEALEIPPNIDPRLLALWIERERETFENPSKKPPKPKARQGRKLNCLFAAFVGVTVMCLIIVLGLVQGNEPNEILKDAAWGMLLYSLFGFIAGCVTEYCVNGSVETLLREIIRRSDEAAASSEIGAEETVAGQET